MTGQFTLSLEDVGELRKALIEAGYPPVPVFSANHAFCNSPGKQPEGAAWQEAARSGRLPPLSPKSINTGVLCDGLRVIDIDVDDEDAARDVAELAREMIGAAPERYRSNSPRRTLVYRAAEGKPRKKSIVSATIKNDDDKWAKVEVLGLGQQFVAFGFHPSGAELLWRGDALHEVPVTELAEVTETIIDQFLAAASEIIGAPTNVDTAAAPVQQSAPELTKPYAANESSDEEIAELLTYVTPDLGYDEWLQVLMSVHSGTQGSASGLHMADQWSSGGAKYKGRKEIEAKWRSFRETGLTMATLAEHARRGGANLSEIATKHRGHEPPPGYDEAEARQTADRILHALLAKRKKAAVQDEEVDPEETLGAAETQFDLPDAMLCPPGLVGELADWICSWTAEPVRIHAIGAALTIVGTLVGRKAYSLKRPTCTALYIGAIAPSGLGKQHPQDAIRLALDEVAGQGRAHTGWNVSLPAIAVALMENASKAMVVDEFADKLIGIRNRNASVSTSAISEGLRSLWGTNTGSYTPDVSVTRGDVKVHRPNLSFYGAATVKDFTRSLISKDVTSGLFNRFLILPRYSHVDVGPDPEGIMTLPDVLRQRLSWLYNCFPDPMQVSLAIRGDGFPASPYMVPFSDEAAAMDEENKSYQLQMMRASDQDDALALYGRFAEQIKRVALITACGRSPHDLGVARIGAEEMKFARQLVEYSITQFVLMVRRDMVENLVEANRAAVLAVIRRKGKVSRSQLLRRIRHINARDMRDIISTLQDAHCIVEEKIETRTNKATVYRYLRG